MDALASVLAVAGVRGTVAATVNAAEPWGLSLHAVPGAAFHAITDGTAWLRISERPDAVGPPDIRLMPGDVVLLPAGAAHTLASAPDVATEPFDHLAARQALTAGGELTVGTGTVQTRILCASYRQDPAVTLPLLTLLPDVVHVPAHRAEAGLESTLRLFAHELGLPRPGAAAVLDRLVDILLVQILRIWLTTTAERTGPASWLSALTHPVAGPALAALHTQPDRALTVDALAAGLNVSTATLARRFTAKVGESPAAYLTRCDGPGRATPARHRRHRRHHRPVLGLHLLVRVQPGIHPTPPHTAGPLPQPDADHSGILIRSRSGGTDSSAFKAVRRGNQPLSPPRRAVPTGRSGDRRLAPADYAMA